MDTDQNRYNVSKMIELLVTRELAAQLSTSSKPGSNQIVTSIINPGFVATDIMRSAGTYYAMLVKVLKALLARTAEEGGRTLVHAAEGGDETHGQYLDDCHPGK
jgi:retinol dehydrogenase-12